jgi:GntP family gluconate:H+ symporter
MPLLHALYLGLATLAIAVLTSRGRIHPLLAVAGVATAFAYASGMSVSLLGKVFGTGFGQTLNTLGLPVLGGAMVGAMGARGFAGPRIAEAAARWGGRTRIAALTLIGVAAGSGTSAGAAFAVLAPLRVALAGAAPRRAAVAMGLAVSAGQGLLLPSPVLIAATAILAAGWLRVLAIGLPLALLSAAIGAMAACRIEGREQAEPPARSGTAWAAAGLVVACLVMALMLVAQSVGDIPSEPFGGGGARETILGAGRPLIVLLAGVAIMIVATGAWRGAALSETGWAAEAIGRATPLMLLLGAAGGLQSLAQSSHMAELLAERVLPLGLGLAVPFLAAAIMKTLQGSSLVAAITAAGMAQPLLAGLGLDSDTGRALAVLAVGAGSVTVTHVNDGFFWLVADAAGMRPGRALATVSTLTLLQGIVMLVALICVGWLG